MIHTSVFVGIGNETIIPSHLLLIEIMGFFTCLLFLFVIWMCLSKDSSQSCGFVLAYNLLNVQYLNGTNITKLLHSIKIMYTLVLDYLVNCTKTTEKRPYIAVGYCLVALDCRLLFHLYINTYTYRWMYVYQKIFIKKSFIDPLAPNHVTNSDLSQYFNHL